MKNNLLKVIFTIFILLFILFTGGNKATLAQSEDQLPTLKSLVLSDDEISKWTDFSNPYDVTDEIEYICFYDCVKMVWGNSDSMLSLVMIRLKSPENAQSALQNLWDIYQSFGRLFIPYDKLENDNQWSGDVHLSRNKMQFVAGGSQGSVVVFVSYRRIFRYSSGDIDGAFYKNLVESMRSAQMKKLQDAGY